MQAPRQLMREIAPSAYEQPAVADHQIVDQAVEAREQGEKSSWREADCYRELNDERGWTQEDIAHACETTQSRVSKFAACARNYSLANNRPTFWEAYEQVDKSRQNHRAMGTGENEWYTPAQYLDAARDVLGDIDLDPASSDTAQEQVRAACYFTKEQNGLAHPWNGRVWLNPPYTQPEISQFASKMVEEVSAGRTTSAIMLTHNYTDTAWFHEAATIADAICFTRGRIKFYDSEEHEAAPTQGQAFFYYGPDVAAFAKRFATIGIVVFPMLESA